MLKNNKPETGMNCCKNGKKDWKNEKRFQTKCTENIAIGGVYIYIYIYIYI